MKRLLLFTFISLTILQLQAQGWGQIQKIVPDDRFIGQYIGATVSIDGNYAVVGVLVSNNAMEAYVYENDGNGNWVQLQKLENPNHHQWDHFGTQVAISGNTIFVGSWGENYDEGGSNYLNSAGAVFIFEKQASGLFEFEQKIVASDREALNAFGYKIALNGDYAIVSPVRHDYDVDGNNFLDDAGTAYIFERDGSGTWNEVQKIVASDRGALDYFGQSSLAVDGSFIVVGSFAEDEDETGMNTLGSAGSAYIFERDGSGTWNEVQKIVPSDREFGENFGASVDISDDTIIVGASNEYLTGNTSAQYGAAYVFESDASGVWNEVQKISPDYTEHQSKFGLSLDLDGNKVIIGGYLMNVGGIGDGGAAFIYEQDGAGMWNKVADLYDSDVSNSDYFGFDVAISGDYAIAGAYQEDEDETGMNFLQEAGSAFIFDANEPNTLPPLETLSVVESTFNANFKVFPNPNQGSFTLDFGKVYNQIDISITNSLGQEIQTQNLQSLDKVNLDLNTDRGIYFVTISTEEGKSAVIKIMKQ